VVRERKDGRVIITDSRDERIVVADLRAGSVQQIGRKGRGPNEYPRALPMWSVGGDSSVMVGSPSRWLRWIAGASLPFTAIRVDDKEKRAHMARLAAVSGRRRRRPIPSAIGPRRSRRIAARWCCSLHWTAGCSARGWPPSRFAGASAMGASVPVVVIGLEVQGLMTDDAY
jgi:hypothetical protein